VSIAPARAAARAEATAAEDPARPRETAGAP
jgi:hypothetical protein